MMEATAFERLSSDLWAQVLKRLTVPDLCAAGLACTAWRASYIDNRDAIWQAVLAAPRVEPYLQGRDVDDHIHRLTERGLVHLLDWLLQGPFH